MAQDALRGLGDIDGLIADALEIVIDARDREDKTQIRGHQLMQREQLHDAVVDFDLQLVDAGSSCRTASASEASPSSTA